MTDRIVVAAGQQVAVPVRTVNRLKSLWGEDAFEFKPERWLNDGEGIPAAAKAVQGHRHLLTFLSGPRSYVNQNKLW
jgi:cytochrome P450